MAEEKKPDDIDSILSDLDSILSDAGGAKPAAPAPELPKPVPVIPPPAAVSVPPPPTPAPVPPPPAPKPEAPPPPAPIPAAEPRGPQIELAPREGMIKPPEKKPVKPPEAVAPPPKPATAPAPTPAAPAPVPAAAAAPAEPAAAGDIAPNTPQEQIRRVAYVYTGAAGEVKLTFAAFLSQAARTISKKPLFLREVLAHEVGAASDANAVVQKALQAKASAVLAVVEGWPPAKIDELSDACSRANLMFRSVASGDAQKKSTAVDIIVDMMLLPGEA